MFNTLNRFSGKMFNTLNRFSRKMFNTLNRFSRKMFNALNKWSTKKANVTQGFYLGDVRLWRFLFLHFNPNRLLDRTNVLMFNSSPPCMPLPRIFLLSFPWRSPLRLRKTQKKSARQLHAIRLKSNDRFGIKNPLPHDYQFARQRILFIYIRNYALSAFQLSIVPVFDEKLTPIL